MIAKTPQLILSFEPPVGTRDDKALLRVCHSMREYFHAARSSLPEFKVQLPSAFQETALMDKDGWRKRPRPAAPAQNLGQRMCMNLPPHLRDEMFEKSPGMPRRVAVLSTGSGMDDIPWEWLNDGPDALVAADPSIRFVRLVPALHSPPPLSVTPPLRVLLVLTNPKDERLLDPYTEIDLVRRGLDKVPEYEVEVLLEPRLDALREKLTWSPHIVHYIGHAGVSGGAGNLILHDNRDGTRWLSAAEVSPYLPSSVRLLCLSTCVTASNYQIEGLPKFAHCPAEIPLPTTIVNQYALEPEQVSAFWQVFYPALLRLNGDVVEAFHEARMVVRGAPVNTWDWASFSLVVRDGMGHPLRIAPAEERSAQRAKTEIQAQWAAQLANSVASRMRSLGAGSQEHWKAALAGEEERVANLESDLEKY